MRGIACSCRSWLMIQEAQRAIAAFSQALEQLVWTEAAICGSTFVGPCDADRVRQRCQRNGRPRPNVIFGKWRAAVAALQCGTHRTNRIRSSDRPFGAGFVRPWRWSGRQCDRVCTNYEYGMSGEMARLLTELAPRLSASWGFLDPSHNAGGGQLGASRRVAPPLGVIIDPHRRARRRTKRSRPCAWTE